jgi:TP901 family phage tail tape measure protein
VEKTVSVRLMAQIQGYISPLKAAIQTTKDFRSEISKAASEGKLEEVGQQAGRMGLALSGGFLLAMMAAARFEKQMSEVGAVVGANSEELGRLSDAALEAGKDTVFSATEAAKAQAELGKAGLTTAEILGGALTGSLSLASAGSLDLAEAADIAAKAMNIFDLTGRDVEHVADVLAAAANKSATDVHELGFALKMGGLAAKNADVSLEETVGTLAAFADSALSGSDAGTSFKVMLQMLAAPSTEAAGRMKQLGIQAYDAQGNFVGMAKLAGNLHDSLKDLTQEQRNEALATIFGSDAMRAATVLYNQGAQGISDYTAKVNDQGAAAEMAAAKTDNLMGDIERLTGSLETLFIEAGTGSNSGIRILVQALTGMIDAVATLPGPVLTVGTVLIGLGGAALLAFSAMVKVRGAMADMVTELSAAGPKSARLGTALETTTKWATRASVAVGILATAAAALDAATAVEVNVSGLAKSLEHFTKTGEASGELTRIFGKDLEDLRGQLALNSSAWGEASRLVESLIPGARASYSALGISGSDAAEGVKALEDELVRMVESGNAGQAEAAVQALREATGASYSELIEKLPRYEAALVDADRATKDQQRDAKEGAKANVELAGAFGEAASEADGLKAAYDRLNGKALEWRESQRAAEQSVDDFRDALSKSGGSLNVHTQQGRDAAAAMDELATKAIEAAQARYDDTGSVREANKVWDTYIGHLRTTLAQAGYTDTEIEKLIGQIAKMPAYKTVDINARINVDWRALQSQLFSRVQSIFAVIPGFRRRWGGVTHHAQSGLLRQAETFSPKAPARYAFAEPATQGEAFIPKVGNYGKSMSILSEAAGWYGADVVPRQQQGWYGGSGGSGGSAQVEVVVKPAPGADRGLMAAVVEGLRFDVRTLGQGSVQNHLGQRGRG